LKLEVRCDDFVITKPTQFGPIERSTGQDKVYVKNVKGIWKHVGYISHTVWVFTGLVGVWKELGIAGAQELGIAIAQECTKIKKRPVRFGGAPESIVELEEEEEDDE